MMHVVLYQPEIPPNTGNIARQCVGMDAHLHLVGPLQIDLSKNAVKRAGLDYWDQVKLTIHDDPESFLAWLGNRTPWLITRHGKMRYDSPSYTDEDILVFGSETQGLPLEWLYRWPDSTVYLPMLGSIRNYNLANTVSVILAQACLRAGLFDNTTEDR